MMIERVLIDIIGHDKASRAFDTAAASASRAGKRIDGAAALTARAGARLTKSVTVPMLAIGAISLDQSVKFQKANTLLQTAGGETVAKMRVISGGIKRVAVDTGTSLGDLETGMYTVAKAGAQKWAAIGQLKVLRAAAEGAKAENVGMATSVDALTSVMQSYGYGVGKAVRVENMLIRGSGLAKTTMEQFAGSLSNVVPLAASLHIGFDQVAGSLATMTQHGESVEQASQNLNNLITNLAGNNNVASTTMQQLGIKTVQLQRNLGKEGLSGALNIVEDALAKNSKGGMVVVSAFKQAQLATHSLDLMVGQMTGKLADNSQALRDGKMSLKDYRDYAKSLGGQQGAMALQYYSLIQKALGFNDALKSGNGDVQTSATMLKKMLGGMTGMRVALMLTGKSAKQNAGNIKEVGDAADKTSKHVIGWGKTSETMSVKVDKLKASAQVLAVNLGDDLIPAAEKTVGWIEKGVTWFDKLSPAMRHNILAAGLVVGALGPLLIIGSRIIGMFKVIGLTVLFGSRFFAGIAQAEISLEGMQTTAYATGLKVRNAFSMARLAAYGMTGAFGFTMGRMSQDSSGGVKAMSALGSAGAGAALGFSMGGGPWGAAIGGLVGGLSSLAGSFLGVGHSSDKANAAAQRALAMQKRAAEAAKARVDGLTAAIEADTGAFKANTRAQVANDLQKRGVLGPAIQLGIRPGQLTKAVLGNQHAQNAISNVLSSTPLAQQSELQRKNIASVIAALGQEGQALKDAAANTDLAALANGKLSLRARTAGQESARLGTALEDGSKSASVNTAFIQAHLSKITQWGAAQLKAGKGADFVSRGIDKQTAAFKKNLVQNGFSEQAVTDLFTLWAKLPKTKTTKAEAKTLAAKSEISDLQNKIDRVKQHDVPGLTANTGLGQQLIALWQKQIDNIRQHKVPKVIADTDQAEINVANIQRHIETLHGKTVVISTKMVETGVARAAGGFVFGPGSSTSDSIPARLSNGEFVVQASQARKHGSLLQAINNGVKGFAAGGPVGKPDPSAVSGAISHIGSTGSSPINLSTVGYVRLEAQIAHAEHVLADQISHGLKAKAADEFRRQIAKLKAEAERQLAHLKVKIEKPDTRALKAALRGTVDDARSAFATLLADARAAGVSPDEIKRIDAAQDKILSKMRERDRINARLGSAPTRQTAYEKLAAAKGNYANEVAATKSAMLGGFDISSAGQVYNDQPATGASILASLKATVAKVKTFGSVLKRLRRKGLSPVLLAQLAHAGPDALGQAQAILSSGDGTIDSITKAYGNLEKYAGAAGQTTGDAMYGAGVKSAQKIVNGLLSQRNALGKAMRRLADNAVDDLDHALHAHRDKVRKGSGHHHGGGHHGHGHGGHHDGRSKPSVHIEKLEINDQRDPVAAANAVTRRLAHLGAA